MIKMEKVHKVGESSLALGQPIDNVPQEFHGEVAVWAKLNHPNILRCFGITVDPFQIVTEWMPNGQAMVYVQEHQDADRVRLVGSLTLVTKG